MKLKTRLAAAILALTLGACREEYVPPAVQVDYNLLVIDGYLDCGADSSFFHISRTQKPDGNTGASAKQERNAQVQILSGNGTALVTAVEKGNGRYAIYSANLPSGEQYQLKVVTGGQEYRSAIVTSKTTPPISDLTWNLNQEGDGVEFLLSTEDPTGNSRYYRWEAEEVYEYRSYLESSLEWFGGQIITRRPEAQIRSCWRTIKSSNIILGSSAAFSQDIIPNFKVFEVKPAGSVIFNVRYSVNIRQFSLDVDAYNYWLNLQKMTETGGSIFDAQPSELIGNIQNVSNPDEPVIGYFSAHSSAQQRIFINATDVPQFSTPINSGCDDFRTIAPAQFSTVFGLGQLVPLYYDVEGTIIGITPRCADCTLAGGTTNRPSFW